MLFAIQKPFQLLAGYEKLSTQRSTRLDFSPLNEAIDTEICGDNGQLRAGMNLRLEKIRHGTAKVVVPDTRIGLRIWHFRERYDAKIVKQLHGEFHAVTADAT